MNDNFEVELAESQEQYRREKRQYIEDWQYWSGRNADMLSSLMRGLTASTFGETEWCGYQKAVLACDLGERLEKNGIAAQYPVIYLASGSDVAFPLCLRFRKIFMVDPDLADSRILDYVRTTLQDLPGFSEQLLPSGYTLFCATFDFGNGSLELIEVTCAPLDAQTFRWPVNEPLGGIISFQNGGVAHPMMFPNLCTELVQGGIIFDNSGFVIEERAMQAHPVMFHSVAKRIAGEYGFTTEYLFQEVGSTPFYVRRGPIGPTFTADMEAAVEVRHAQAVSAAEARDQIRKSLRES